MSDFTRTPNYQLYKPTPNADNDAWGAHLNTNADTLDSALASGGGGANNVGRNLLHNPLFRVAQRAAGPWTANGAFTLDRWLLSLSLDTVSITQAAHSDASRAQIGDEAATFLLANTFTGNAGAAAFNRVMQRIEDVRRLAGKTVTVSFWAASGAGTPKLGIGIVQNFGTGGSPSAAVVVAGQSVTIGTTYTRYSLTFAIPSASGKTLGTANDHNTELSIWFSSGTTNAVSAGSPGVQSGTINIWGCQLEIGSVATPLAKIDPRYDLANCQRFYQTFNASMNAYAAAGAVFGYTMPLLMTMRAAPTSVTISAQTYTNASGMNASAPGGATVSTWATATALGTVAYSGTLAASADL